MRGRFYDPRRSVPPRGQAACGQGAGGFRLPLRRRLGGADRPRMKKPLSCENGFWVKTQGVITL